MKNSNQKPKTFVYVDSFNLYYGALRKKKMSGLKWLNINSCLQMILPSHEIKKIKFFTAKVSGKYDPTKPQRQDIYFRALKTLTNIEMIFGNFLFKDSTIHISRDVRLTAKVPEEKGTDVNLAVHLLNDAHKNKFDNAVIISNDSDLAETVRIVTNELNMTVGIINPCGNKTSKKLAKYASFIKTLRTGVIKKTQFPDNLVDPSGKTITKPNGW
jgi:uncharacterized LabA/DUF88 family protein